MIFYHSFLGCLGADGSSSILMAVKREEKGSTFCAVLGTAVSCPACHHHLHSWSPNVNTWHNSEGVLLTLSTHVDDLPSLSRLATSCSHTTDPLIYGLRSICNSFLLCHHLPPTSPHPLSKLEDSFKCPADHGKEEGQPKAHCSYYSLVLLLLFPTS